MHETVRRAGGGCGEPKPCPGYTRLRLDAAGALDFEPTARTRIPHLTMSRRERQRRRRKSRGFPLGRVIGVGVVLVVCAVAIGAAAAAGWVLDVAHSAPNLSKKPTINPGSPSQVFASDGTSLGYIYSPTSASSWPTARCPKLVRRATIAIEDRRFYQHGALDYEGIIRAAFKDIAHGSTALQGASTLTEQVVDNAYLPKSIDKDRKARNLKYKIEQAKLALQLEQKHSKRWILTKYLNVVPYGTVGGETAYGIARRGADVLRQAGREAAASTRWRCSPGCRRHRAQYNPFLHPAAARARRNQVLQAMVTAGDISPAQGQRAARRPLTVKPDHQYSTQTEPVRVQVHRGAGRSRSVPTTTRTTARRCATAAEDLLDARSAPTGPGAGRDRREPLAAGRGRPHPGVGRARVGRQASNGHILALATSDQWSADDSSTTPTRRPARPARRSRCSR